MFAESLIRVATFRNHCSRHSGLTTLAAALFATIGLVAGCGDDSTGPTGLQPTVDAVSPDSGTVGTQVEITGVNFEAGLGVSFGPLQATSIVVVSSNTILVHAPDGLDAGQAYDVLVTNPGLKSDVKTGAFRAVPPDLMVVNGVSRPSGLRGSTIIFEGRAFGDLLGKGSVWFTDDTGQPLEAPVVNEDNWTNEFIVTTVPQSAATGPSWVETPTGTSAEIAFRISEGATFSPSQIHWTETAALPEPSQGHRAVYLSGEDAGTENVIYVTGGADGTLTPRTSVWRSSLDQVGLISTWTTEGYLAAERAFHGAALATPFNALMDTTMAGHIYIVGGIEMGGAATASVLHASVLPDRSTGAWVEETPLPVPLHSPGVTIFRSWLYVAGGATSGHVAVATVYRARIQFDGSLGTWESQPSLPEPRAYSDLTQFGGVLYVAGGDTGTVPPGTAAVSQTQTSTIYYHALDLRTGELRNPSWSLNPSGLIKAVAKHSTLVAGGTVLVSGGVYNGSGNSATEHQYASIELDGTIGSFGGATGSQTIAGSSGAGGVPFFNHAAITYVDGAGEAHVVIIAGNNINDPSTPTERNFVY